MVQRLFILRFSRCGVAMVPIVPGVGAVGRRTVFHTWDIYEFMIAAFEGGRGASGASGIDR